MSSLERRRHCASDTTLVYQSHRRKHTEVLGAVLQWHCNPSDPLAFSRPCCLPTEIRQCRRVRLCCWDLPPRVHWRFDTTSERARDGRWCAASWRTRTRTRMRLRCDCGCGADRAPGSEMVADVLHDLVAARCRGRTVSRPRVVRTCPDSDQPRPTHFGMDALAQQPPREGDVPRQAIGCCRRMV